MNINLKVDFKHFHFELHNIFADMREFEIADTDTTRTNP